jgi:NADPH-dependent 2,4-dienoyl-CoA reductase/sulfur reductase-like enzyme
MPKKILIIGGNATGLKAAVRIKRLDPAADVTIEGQGFKNVKFMDGGLVG